LLLGLLVTPHELVRSIGPTLAIAGMLMFIARPLAVWLCLAPLRFTARERLFIGWVGLRGAVPIVLALLPLMEKVPRSHVFFNVAFAVVLASLLLQGTSLRFAARRLGLDEPPPLPPGEQRAVHGRLTLDADLPVADTFEFFQLPVPPNAERATLREWMVDKLARDPAQGDAVDWKGAHFEVGALHDGRIARVALTLSSRGKAA